MTTEMILKADRCLEWAVGKVAGDKTAWMYGKYFGIIGPVMAEYGAQSVGTFVVVSSSLKGVQPTSGAFTTWASAKDRIGFHEDARFLKLKQARDEALSAFSDGHAFESMDEVIALNTDSDYAVIIAQGNPLVSDPVFDLSLKNDSPQGIYAGETLSLQPWSDAAEQLLSNTPHGAEV